MGGLRARAALLALAAIVAAVCLTALLSRPTHALSFTVDTTTDAVDAHPGDGVCATSAGQCSLRAAVQESNALSGADVISLPAGTFALTIAGSGEGEAATGDLDISDDLTIAGVSANDTIVSGGSIDRVFDIAGQFAVHFSGFMIRDGNADIDGGAVINRGTMTLQRMNIENNTARDGGGLYNNGTMTVLDTTVIDNAARDSGAGIHNDGALTVTRSSIVHNRATFAGGGINNLNSLTVTESAIIDNDAAGERGGALSNSAEALLTNVTVSGNHAAYSAGGMVNFGNLGLTNVTVTNNAGGLLHAVIDNYETGHIVFANTIVAGNGDINCRSSGMLTSNGHNLDDGNTCGFGSVGDVINTDGALAPLADNGGPTKTHALLPVSPAIDAGGGAGCPPTDQRGYSRIAVCDIGAYEFGSVAPGATATRMPMRTATRTPTPLATVFAAVGDVDCDGRIDSIDAAIVLQFVAGLYDFSRCPVSGDVNHDRLTNAVDAAIILQYSAGLLTHWPP